jgi:hypothetical protein
MERFEAGDGTAWQIAARMSVRRDITSGKRKSLSRKILSARAKRLRCKVNDLQARLRAA